MVNALIITGFGLNCERETAAAFTLAGATPRLVHLNELIQQPARLDDAHILAFIGGFSFGDHLGAGTVFANRVRTRLGDPLLRYIAAGKLIIGICNGFQTITRLGIVPALDGQHYRQSVALARNDQGTFRDAWITVQANPASPCIFTRGIDQIPLPIRHGEGKFVAESEDTLARLEAAELVALRYMDTDEDQAASEFPHNPNGSVNAIAGICDPTGRIFGLMPHPEAYLSPFNHPHWVRQKIHGVLPTEGLGAAIFRNAVNFAATELA
jgi:phosphoribosylformylglycinamidine synthase